jgi:hypothetical protein
MKMFRGGQDRPLEQQELGYCAVANCRHVEMELRHKCDTSKRFVHIICLMENDLLISIVGGSGNYHYCSRLCVR